MRGVSEEHIRCDTQRANNDADGPFSSQPFGPWPVGLIFRVAHSLRIDLDMLVVRALKINQLTDGGLPPTCDSMHYLKDHQSCAKKITTLETTSESLHPKISFGYNAKATDPD
jgi:hypothetical protein